MTCSTLARDGDHPGGIGPREDRADNGTLHQIGIGAPGSPNRAVNDVDLVFDRPGLRAVPNSPEARL